MGTRAKVQRKAGQASVSRFPFLLLLMQSSPSPKHISFLRSDISGYILVWKRRREVPMIVGQFGHYNWFAGTVHLTQSMILVHVQFLWVIQIGISWDRSMVMVLVKSQIATHVYWIRDDRWFQPIEWFVRTVGEFEGIARLVHDKVTHEGRYENHNVTC